MAWTTPATWTDGVAVTAAQLNAQIRDNLRYLKGLDGVPYIEAAVELPEMTTPSTPASGRGRVFIGNTGVRNGVASCVDDTGAIYQMVRYEEGTFTPIFVGSTDAGSYTYALQVGRYERIGRTIHLRGAMTISAINIAPSGTMRIGGLPFVAAQHGGVSFTQIRNFNYATGALQLVGYIAAGRDYITLLETVDNTAGVDTPAANFTNPSCQLWFVGSYEV
jgi:hypothetical protein